MVAKVVSIDGSKDAALDEVRRHLADTSADPAIGGSSPSLGANHEVKRWHHMKLASRSTLT